MHPEITWPLSCHRGGNCSPGQLAKIPAQGWAELRRDARNLSDNSVRFFFCPHCCLHEEGEYPWLCFRLGRWGWLWPQTKTHLPHSYTHTHTHTHIYFPVELSWAKFPGGSQVQRPSSWNNIGTIVQFLLKSILYLQQSPPLYLLPCAPRAWPAHPACTSPGIAQRAAPLFHPLSSSSPSQSLGCLSSTQPSVWIF